MSNTNLPYLHGFSKEEQDRLRRQGELAEFTIYKNIDLSKCQNLIEIGSGVGVQTEIILRRFPKIHITSIEMNDKQIKSAEAHLSKINHAQNRFQIKQMNAEKLDIPGESFDGAFLCWILEHVPSPKKVLSEVRRVLKPGSVVYITEVFNASFFLEPYSPSVWKYWMAYNDYQYDHAGDPFIGAKLGNFLQAGGFKDIFTEVRTWHLDSRFPEQRRKQIVFWKELLLSAEKKLVEAKYIDELVVKNMKKEFSDVETDPDSVFFYSFIQAKATV